MRAMGCVLVLGAMAGPVFGQLPPVINTRRVVNMASRTPQDLPGGAIAPGSLITILGRLMGPTTAVQAASSSLATTLANVSIKVRQGNTTVDALPMFVSAAQIDALLPANTPAGRAAVQVAFEGRTSNTAFAVVAPSSFGAFAVAGAEGPGLVQNFESETDQPVNSLARSAIPGQVVSLWGTGLGTARQAEVFVGGKAAGVLYAGPSACGAASDQPVFQPPDALLRGSAPALACVGLDQVIFTIPADAPLGCYVPVYVRAGGTVANTVTMAVAAEAGPCSDPANPLTATLAQGGRFGGIALLRGTTLIDIGVAPAINAGADQLNAFFREQPASDWFFTPALALPPAGACNTYSAQINISAGILAATLDAAGRTLDAGSQLTFTSALGARSATSRADVAKIYFGMSFTAMMFPSSYQISAAGGADVGKFAFDLPVPAGVNWTGRAQLSAVTRTSGLQIAWTPDGRAGVVVITGASLDNPVNTIGTFLCTASPLDGTFTVPPYVLARLPATRARAQQATGVVSVGFLPVQDIVSFTADGLDAGFAIAISGTAKSVVYR